VLNKTIAFAAGIVMLLAWGAAPPVEPSREAEMARLRNIGRAHYEEEKYEDSLRTFQRCVALSPDSAVDEINLGIVLVQLGRYKEAQGHLAKGEELDQSLAPYASYNRAISLKREKQFPEAAAQFEKTRKLDPACPDTAYNLAVVYESFGQLEKAFDELSRAVELAPDEISPHYRRMILASRLGKKEIALAEQKTFTELRAVDSRARTPEELERSLYTEIVEPERARVVPAAPVTKNPLGVMFKDVTIESGLSPDRAGSPLLSRRPLCWGDVDGDPRPDLLFLGPSPDKPIELWRNRGGGAFVEVSAEAGLRNLNGRAIAIACGDLDHDGDNELCASDEEGIHVLFKRFGPHPKATALAASEKAVQLLLVDFDHDGDLDLYAATQATAPKMYRNNGKGEFEAVPAESGLSGDGTAASLLAFIDFDDDNDTDFFLAGAGKPNQLLSSMRMGRFQDVAAKIGVTEPTDARDAAIADINNDGWLDIVLLQQNGEVVGLLGKRIGEFERSVLAKVEHPGGGLAVLDYDNDGDEDLFAAGRLFQNDGKFTDITADVGLELQEPEKIIQAAPEDFDEDGDTDLAVCWNDGRVVLLRNEAGNRNCWIRVSLEGLQSNRSGVQTKVEVRDGTFFQRKVCAGRPLLFGLGERKSLDVLRLWWPTGVAQNVLSPKVGETVNVREKLGPPSSCPFVYIWDGEKFSFLTDALDAAALGVPLGGGNLLAYRNKEDVLMPGARMRVKDGRLVIQLTGELRELAYLDRATLTAVDHSAYSVVYPDESAGPPGTGETRLHCLRDLQPPLAATDDASNDLKETLARLDGRYATSLGLTRFHGLAETHTLFLDFGDTSAIKQPVLVLSGWIKWIDGDTLFALGQGAGPSPLGPVLEMQRLDGGWEKVSDNIGVPAGISKNLVVELPPQLCHKSTRLRITTNQELYLDRTAIGDAGGPQPTKLHALKLIEADLHFRGFSKLVLGVRGKPPWYDYAAVTSEAPYLPQKGFLTRFGDVLPLLSKTDDRLVIFGPGDELTLTFAAPPPLSSGQQRDFILRLDGWIKDANPSTYTGDCVEPLPYRAMRGYPSGAEEGLLDDPSYAEYLALYNTRPLRRDVPNLRWSAATGY
jgi:hypothetical protein